MCTEVISWALCFFDADEETKKLTWLNQPHEIENLLIRMLQDTGNPTPDLHFTLQTSTLHDYIKERKDLLLHHVSTMSLQHLQLHQPSPLSGHSEQLYTSKLRKKKII